MKTIFTLVMFVSCAITSLAGIGETLEEAIKRYGEPDIMGNTNSASFLAVYFEAEPMKPISISFFRNKEGKSILGNLTYKISKELTKDYEDLAESEILIILKILGDHAGGQIWTTMNEESGSLKQTWAQFRREGATALWVIGDFLKIELDEYTEFEKKESERQEIEQRKESERQEIEQRKALAKSKPYIDQIEKGLKSQFYYMMIPRGRIQVMSALSSQMESPNLRQKRFSINILESLDAYQKQGLISYTEQEQSDSDFVRNIGARNYTVTILQKAIDASDTKISNNDFLYISKGECAVLSVVKDIPYTHRDLAQSDDFRLVVGTYKLTHTGLNEERPERRAQVLKFRAIIKINPFNKTYSLKEADWGYLNDDDWMTSNISQ